MNYDIEVDWHINDFCNFNCIYCFDKCNKKQAFIGLSDTKKIINAFDKTGLVWLIGLTGGEPFFVPNFLGLCEGLTKKHSISINTNLSHKDVVRFSEIINPEKVSVIHCSLHIQERKRLNLVKDFINKYRLLKEKGFFIYASYLMYPHLLGRFKKDYLYFKSEDITLKPKIFKGNCSRFKIIDSPIFKKIRHYFGSNFPEAYSQQQKKIIKDYMLKSEREGDFNHKQSDILEKGILSDVSFDEFSIDGLPSFKGLDCLAGKKFVRMTPQGDVYRCHGEKQYMGNLFDGHIEIFDGPKKCTANVCRCAYVGYKYVLKNDWHKKD